MEYPMIPTMASAPLQAKNVPCSFTRDELTKLLQQSEFGANEAMFSCYFKKDPVYGTAVCGACSCPVGEHGNREECGRTATTAGAIGTPNGAHQRKVDIPSVVKIGASIDLAEQSAHFCCWPDIRIEFDKTNRVMRHQSGFIALSCTYCLHPVITVPFSDFASVEGGERHSTKINDEYYGDVFLNTRSGKRLKLEEADIYQMSLYVKSWEEYLARNLNIDIAARPR